MSRILAASVAVVVALVVAAASVVVDAQVLAKYPSLRCSACQCTVEVLGKKMNDTADPKKTILTSHRLERSERRTSYANSELRGYDIIEKLCEQNSYGSYMLRETPGSGLRIFSAHSPLQQCMPYDDEDRKELHDTMASKYISRMCEDILSEHEEALIAIIKKNPTLDQLTEAICNKTVKVCGTKKHAKGVEEDLARRAAWRKRTGIRTGTDVKNDEAKEKAEKEANETKAAAEGAPAAADAGAGAPPAENTATETPKNPDL
jgi:hypothetical protein